MMTVRRYVRIKAFQALFQLEYNFRSTKEEAVSYAVTHELEATTDQDIDLIAALKETLPEENVTDKMAKDALEYLTQIVHGVVDNKEFIDEQIENRLEDWTIKRLDIPNLLILRIATYELYFNDEIDPRIVMNEAIEMTKSFNNDKASKFVNGVLQGILDTKEA